MSNNDSTFTIKIDSRGSDVANRDLGKVNKSFEDLTKTAKTTVKELDEIRKRSAGIATDFQNLSKTAGQVAREFGQMALAERNLMNSVQATNRELDKQAQLLKVVTGTGGPMNVSFNPPGAAGPRIINGGAPNVGVGGSGGSGVGATYKGPSGGGGGIPWGKIGTGALNLLGAGNMALGMYGQYLQHSGRHMVEDKTMGAENLVRSQAYRNFLYNEAVSGPIGWAGMKRGISMKLRTRDSAGSEVDDQGNIQGSQAGATRSETKGSFVSAAAKMTGEAREISGEKISAISQGIAGAIKIMAGAGAGFALGGPLGALTGGIGTAVMTGAGSDIMNAVRGYKHADRKLATGDLEAQQAERAAQAEHIIDQLRAIQRRQIGAFEEASGESVSLGRQTLGAADLAMSGMYGGYSAGEMGSVIGGLRRGAGSRAGGTKHMAAVLQAGNMGMDLGTGTKIMGASESAGADGARNLERIFAAGIKQGMGSLEMGFFEKLGGAFAESLYSGSSGARSSAVGAMLFSGLGPSPSAHAVDENVRGQGMDRNIFKGNNYFSSRALVEAANVLGEGGRDVSNVDIMSLGESSLADLAGEGSSGLRAVLKKGGLNDDEVTQRIQSFRSRRINMLGDTIGGPFGKEIAGAGGLENFMTSMVGQLGGKDAKARHGAEEQLQALGMTLSKTLGEEDAGAIMGMLRGIGGAGNAAAQAFMKGSGKLPGVVSGLDAQVIDFKKRRKFDEIKAGKKYVGNEEAAAGAMQVLEDTGPMNPRDQALYEKIKSGNATATEIQSVNERQNRINAATTANMPDEYGNTQKLLGEIAPLIKRMDTLIASMDNFVKAGQRR